MATLLEKAKGVCRVNSTTFDDEITDLIAAGLDDMKWFTDIDSSFLINSDSMTYEPSIIRALMTYVSMEFKLRNGQIDANTYDRLKASYDEQKKQMIMSSKFNSHSMSGADLDEI